MKNHKNAFNHDFYTNSIFDTDSLCSLIIPAQRINVKQSTFKVHHAIS